MCLKIRCDGKSEKFCKIFYELNKAQLLLVCVVSLSLPLLRCRWTQVSKKKKKLDPSFLLPLVALCCLEMPSLNFQDAAAQNGTFIPTFFLKKNSFFARALFTSKKFYLQNRNSSTFVCIWQILSNHVLTRLKRFISQITDKLCN